jgi:predicted PurR-regulated permease PerM
MKYFPDLIPKDKKVLPEYFKADQFNSGKKSRSSLLLMVSFAFTMLFTVIAIAKISHPILAILFGILAFISSPSGHDWIERKFRFSYTSKIKSLSYVVLIIITSVFSSYYEDVDKRTAIAQKLQEQREELVRQDSIKKEQTRKDSLTYYIQTALQNKTKAEYATELLDKAFLFSVTDSVHP